MWALIGCEEPTGWRSWRSTLTDRFLTPFQQHPALILFLWTNSNVGNKRQPGLKPFLYWGISTTVRQIALLAYVEYVTVPTCERTWRNLILQQNTEPLTELRVQDYIKIKALHRIECLHPIFLKGSLNSSSFKTHTLVYVVSHGAMINLTLVSLSFGRQN